MTVMQETLKRDDGGPAFAARATTGTGYVEGSEGMSLRDYFAAQALPSAMAECRRVGIGVTIQPERASQLAYEVADAMIEARK